MLVTGHTHAGIIAAEYSTKESAGVSSLVGVSCFSLVAVLGLFFLMAASAWINRGNENKNYFFRTNVATYFICLLVADLIQAIGSIMNARWIEMGGVHHGRFCSAQGVIKHISDIGGAAWSFVISVHTFCLLFYQLHSPRWVGWIVLVLVNGVLVMLTFLGPIIYRNPDKGEFYGISGYWCWITYDYSVARVTMDYLILFLSAFLSFVLYSLVFFRLRGNIVVNGWRVRFRKLEKDESGWRGRQHADSRALSVAKQMIMYPIAYTILFLPIAVLRMCEWAGHPISFEITMFCDSIFLLGGVVNVVLFCSIRRVIPVKEVLVGIFTGKAFRKRDNEPEDPSWCIGTMESGEKDAASDISVLANDDYFALRQPKFEIVTPPQAILPDQPVTEPTTQTPETAPTQNIVPADPPRITVPIDSPSIIIPIGPLSTTTPIGPPRITTPTDPSRITAPDIHRKPLPIASPIHHEDGEGFDHHPSSSRHHSVRRLPPIPQGPKSAPLQFFVVNGDPPPPPYRPDTAHHRHSISGSFRSHGHSVSYDSAFSDTPLLRNARPPERK